MGDGASRGECEMWNGGEGTILSQSCTCRCRKASQARNNDEDRGLWMVGCGIVGTTRALSENRKKTLITRSLPPADKARLVPTSIPLTSSLTSPLCTLHSVLKSPSLRGFVTTKWQLCERTFTWMQFPCEDTILSQSCTYRYRKASQARNNDEDRGLWMVGCGICRDNACVVRKPRENTNYQTSAASGQGTPCPYIIPPPLSPLPSHLFPLPLCTLYSILKSGKSVFFEGQKVRKSVFFACLFRGKSVFLRC